MRRVLATVVAVLALAGSADARVAVRAASEAETHAIAVDVRQPRWSCFEGRIARGRPWAALRLLPGGGCPELPYAIVVREDRTRGWIELRRFWTRRAACRAQRPALTRALVGCGRGAAGYSADSSHQYAR